jgi:hypothetical protein
MPPKCGVQEAIKFCPMHNSACMLLFEIERERAKKSEQRPKLVNANADTILVLGALAIRIHIREQNKVSADPDGEKNTVQT